MSNTATLYINNIPKENMYCVGLLFTTSRRVFYVCMYGIPSAWPTYEIIVIWYYTEDILISSRVKQSIHEMVSFFCHLLGSIFICSENFIRKYETSEIGLFSYFGSHITTSNSSNSSHSTICVKIVVADHAKHDQLSYLNLIIRCSKRHQAPSVWQWERQKSFLNGI